MHTAADFDVELINTIVSDQGVAMLFDDQLNYVAVSAPACIHFRMKKEELIGRCVLDIFPDIIASANHRNMLRALKGESIMNSRIVSRMGIPMETSYIPVYPDGYVKGILVYAKKIEDAV
jgi:hypothetical protein